MSRSRPFLYPLFGGNGQDRKEPATTEPVYTTAPSAGDDHPKCEQASWRQGAMRKEALSGEVIGAFEFALSYRFDS